MATVDPKPRLFVMCPANPGSGSDQLGLQSGLAGSNLQTRMWRFQHRRVQTFFVLGPAVGRGALDQLTFQVGARMGNILSRGGGGARQVDALMSSYRSESKHLARSDSYLVRHDSTQKHLRLLTRNEGQGALKQQRHSFIRGQFLRPARLTPKSASNDLARECSHHPDSSTDLADL